jgi:hypothetical protein
MMLSLLVGFGLLFSGVSRAEDDHSGFSAITGTNASLIFHDHTFSGRVGEALVWGEAACKDAFAVVKMRYHGQSFEARIEKDSTGTLATSLTVGDRQIELVFDKIDASSKTIMLTMNGELLPVRVTAEGMQGKHLVNPSFEMEIDGKEFSYKVEDGQACWGLAVKLAMMLTLVSAL